MTYESKKQLKEIFDNFAQPKIKKSDSIGDYMIIHVSNTGYNDDREHSFDDESLEEIARSKLDETDDFSYIDIKLEHPNWLSDTIYVKVNN